MAKSKKSQKEKNLGPFLFKNLRIVDPESKHHNKVKDILIESGKILKIADKITVPSKCFVKDFKGLNVSPGWFDFRVRFCDPGFEHQEDISSGIEAAMSGGFTGVAVMPSTNPIVHSKSIVEYISRKAEGALVDVHPVGAITKNLEGKVMAEMYDMHEAGAIAFSDDKNSIDDSGIFLRALLYVQNFGGLIIHYACDTNLSKKGMMHEGPVSNRLGLAGIPTVAEQLTLSRDLLLAKESNSGLHFAALSSTEGVALIRDAKKKLKNISCDVNAHQLVFSDEDLFEFDSNYKVIPPYRSKQSRNSLLEGLKDGTIDIICSDHTPLDTESKHKEFDFALPGIIGMETLFAILNMYCSKDLSLGEIIQKISHNPRRRLSLEVPILEVGKEANLTIFDSKLEWVYDEKNGVSKSKNSPFLGKKLIGKAIAVFNKSQYFEI